MFLNTLLHLQIETIILGEIKMRDDLNSDEDLEYIRGDGGVDPEEEDEEYEIEDD